MNLKENLIFMHIPKNGGTTLDSILDRIYPAENIFNIQPISSHQLNDLAFMNLPKSEMEKIHLLKGHISFGIHDYMIRESKYITLLRNPEERIISFYYFVLEQPNHRLYDQVKNGKMSLYDFATKIDQHDVNNAQIRAISGIDDQEDKMLKKAIENIERHFSFVGLVEKFNESLVLLQDIYQFPTPYYLFLNKTSKRVSINEIDEKTRKAIQDLNKGDMKLYSIIEEKFNKKLSETDMLKNKLFKLNLANRYHKFSSNKNVVQLKSQVKNIYTPNSRTDNS